MNLLDKIEELTFQDLIFSEYKVKIPPYQRAYAWKEKQIDDFINDLISIEDKKYYFGHFIIEKNEKEKIFEIIDGQQRITTFVLFLLACIKKHSNFTFCEELENFINERFETIDYDSESFKKIISSIFENKELTIDKESKTSSIIKIEGIIKYFEEKLIYGEEKLKQFLNSLLNANISLHIVEDKSVAVQIFELQNSRGIKLNLLEKVKAKLMKELYLNCELDLVHEKIKLVQGYFSEIYQLEEKTIESSFRGNISLENILLFHLRVVDDGSKLNKKNKENFLHSPSYTNYNEGVLKYISEQISNSKDKVSYIINLSELFMNSVEFVCQKMVDLDKKNPLVGDCIILDRNNSLELFLILLHLDRFSELDLKRWELLLFTRDFHTKYYNKKGRDDFQWLFKRVISKEEDINSIIKNFIDLGFRGNMDGYKLQEVCSEYLKNNKEQVLKNAFNFWKEKMTYLLYKYEIDLEESIREDLRKIFKDRKSLEHILPQSRESDWYGNEVEFENKVKQIENGVGNLIILSSSENSQESNSHPKDKKYSINKGSYKIHHETKGQWKDFNKWDEIILGRGEKIYGFLVEYFFEDRLDFFLED